MSKRLKPKDFPPLGWIEMRFEDMEPEIREQHRLCLASRQLRRSKILLRLLNHAIVALAEKRPDDLREKIIATDFFGKPRRWNSKDPTSPDNATVRNHEQRLGDKLEEYYAEGRLTDVRIALVVGSYVPRFLLRQGTHSPVFILLAIEHRTIQRLLAPPQTEGLLGLERIQKGDIAKPDSGKRLREAPKPEESFAGGSTSTPPEDSPRSNEEPSHTDEAAEPNRPSAEPVFITGRKVPLLVLRRHFEDLFKQDLGRERFMWETRKLWKRLEMPALPPNVDREARLTEYFRQISQLYTLEMREDYDIYVGSSPFSNFQHAPDWNDPVWPVSLWRKIIWLVWWTLFWPLAASVRAVGRIIKYKDQTGRDPLYDAYITAMIHELEN